MSTDSLPLSELESSPSIKFDALGDKVKGRITSVRRTQQTDFDDGTPLTWANGDPRMQTLIVLDVDGEQKTLYCKGGKFEVVDGTGLALEAAVVAAVKAAGGDSIEVGAELAVEHTGLGRPPKRGAKAPKLYAAQYRPATQSVPVDDLFSDS